MIRLFRFLKPYRFMIIGVIILVFIQTLGDLLLPTLNADVIDEGVMKGDTDRIIRTGGLMLIVWMHLRAAISWNDSYDTSSRKSTHIQRCIASV